MSSEAPSVSASQLRAPAAERITPITCQVSGRAWQKACRRPSGSGVKALRAVKMTPLVPRTSDAGLRSSVTPTPRAPAAWSPAPAATGTPSAVWPVTAPDSWTAGSQLGSTANAAASSELQARRPTSSSTVPEASETSVASSPVRRKRT